VYLWPNDGVSHAGSGTAQRAQTLRDALSTAASNLKAAWSNQRNKKTARDARWFKSARPKTKSPDTEMSGL
jgi:hypothetical protein